MKISCRTTAVLLLVFAAACSSAMRYSADEIKGFPADVQEHVTKGEISVGMTMLQVRYAWGGPNQVIVLKPAEDGKERLEWVYKSAVVFKTRLIFTGDRLTEILSSQPGVVK